MNENVTNREVLEKIAREVLQLTDQAQIDVFVYGTTFSMIY